MLSSYTHPHVISNLYKFLSYVEHKISYFKNYPFKGIKLSLHEKKNICFVPYFIF